jgi:hypothetical protein
MRETPASSFFPPIALQKEREGLVAGRVLEGGEAWMYALCVGNVAATKSAKDKGFSKVFMSVFIWAKVGRGELCQWWRSFWVSDERRDFALGDRDEGGMAA